jgi:hypothetical protein
MTGNRRRSILDDRRFSAGKVSMNHAPEAGQEIHLKAGMTAVIEAFS